MKQHSNRHFAIFVSAGFFLLWPLELSAQSGSPAQVVKVSYVEGEASVQTPSGWRPVKIGDSLSPDTTLRIGQGANVELEVASLKLLFRLPGTYGLKDTLARSMPLRSHALTNALTRLGSSSAGRASAAAGTRGADESKADHLGYVSSNTEALQQAGQINLGLGRYDQAIDELTEALLDASDDETRGVSYLLAQAYALKGEVREALTEITAISLTNGEPWVADAILLKAYLLLQASDYDQAATTLQGAGTVLSADSQRAQLYWYLLATALRAKGDAPGTKRAAQAAVTVDPNSDLGQAAKELLQ